MTLKQWIDREGYNQKDAAAVLGIDQPSLSRMLSGRTIGSRETLKQIAERTDGAVMPNDVILGEQAA